jgi:hypothetical protein
MKLTNKDKEYLIAIGYSDNDLTAIEDAIRNIRYEVFDSIPINITQKEAIRLLGREEFLSGVARATFHSSAVRHHPTMAHVVVYFTRTKF